MSFFNKRRKDTINQKVKVADVFVITSMIISSYNDGTGLGPRCVTMYFLAKSENDEWYELFSGRKLEKEKEPEDGILSQTFDTPYVEKAEPLAKYLKNPNKIMIDTQSLFDFITNMNVRGVLGAFSKGSKKNKKSR